MEKHLIVVEGKADAVFIKDFILFLFSDNENFIASDVIEPFKRGKAITIFQQPVIKVLNAGGFTKLTDYKTKLIEASDMGYQIIVIQDTDNKDKDYGGIKARSNYLDNLMENFDIQFHYFLLPNHKDEGDLETLLLKIVNPEKFKEAFRCYKQYVECVGRIANEQHSHELLQEKQQVFSYLRTFNGIDKAKEENRDYLSIYWDFEHHALKELYDFFRKHIVSS